MDDTVQEGLQCSARRGAMTAVLIGVGLATLDSVIINTALPTIARNLGVNDSTSVWIVNGYQLAVVALLLPLAALGDIIGHRSVYAAGLLLFTVTSACCGLAWSLPSLLVARAAQGLGAAGILSSNIALIRFIYPAHRLGRGFGLNALIVAISFTAGPTLGTAILSLLTWHWLFMVNVPIGLIAIVLSWRTLPSTEPVQRRFDVRAAAACALCLTFLTLGFGIFLHRGSWVAGGCAWAVALVSGKYLSRRERNQHTPLLPLDLLRSPAFRLSSLTAICSFTTQGLAFVWLPFLFQNVMGRTTAEVGLLMTPWPTAVALIAPLAGCLSDRYSPALLGGAGLLVLSATMASLASMPADVSALGIGVRMTLCGIGFGFFQSPNLRAFMASAPPQRSGGAGGIVALSRLLGQTIGAALVAMCMSYSETQAASAPLWLGCTAAGAGCIASLVRLKSVGLKRDWLTGR